MKKRCAGCGRRLRGEAFSRGAETSRRASRAPPRYETLAFRVALEEMYRLDLGRPLTGTSVDAEGVATWLAEYLRYRLNACSQETAQTTVMREIQGASPHAGCH